MAAARRVGILQNGLLVFDNEQEATILCDACPSGIWSEGRYSRAAMVRSPERARRSLSSPRSPSGYCPNTRRNTNAFFRSAYAMVAT